ILQDYSEPSNDNTNVVNALQDPFVVNQDPCENSSQSLLQINHHCCYGCGDPLEDIFCHQCTCELCRKVAHYGYICPQKVPIIHNLESFNNQTVDELPQTLPSFDPTCYSEDGNSFTYNSKSNLVHDSPNVFNPPLFDQFQPPQYTVNHLIFNAQNDLFNSQNELIEQLTSMCDMVGQYIQKKKEEKQIEEEQVVKVRYWKISTCYDDDDDDYTIAITHKEPDNSLSMGDEHLDTILATESDEFIKSGVENLVPNPYRNTGILNVNVMGYISKHKVHMPRLMSTQPTLVPNQEKSPNLLFHQGHEAFQPSTECPMMIYVKNTPILNVPFFHFYLL
nr:hypothetical protein [Tanacetum cinerariifolium]